MLLDSRCLCYDMTSCGGRPGCHIEELHHGVRVVSTCDPDTCENGMCFWPCVQALNLLTWRCYYQASSAQFELLLPLRYDEAVLIPSDFLLPFFYRVFVFASSGHILPSRVVFSFWETRRSQKCWWNRLSLRGRQAVLSKTVLLFFT